jgi:hypothetical protein
LQLLTTAPPGHNTLFPVADAAAERSRHSNRYVEYLHQWDASRRLKKAVPGPREGYQARQ